MWLLISIVAFVVFGTLIFDLSVESNGLVFPRAHRLTRGLTWLYAGLVLAVLVWLALGSASSGSATGLSAMAREWIDGGLAAIVLPALFLALTACVSALALTSARTRYAAAEIQSAEGQELLVDLFSLRLKWRQSMVNPGFAARQGQAVIWTTGALLVWASERLLWPGQPPATDTEVAAGVGVAVGLVFMLAFASLMAERAVNAFPEPQLPEAPRLRRLLFFTTLLLAAGGILELFHGAGATWVRWLVIALACLPGLVVLELTARALARLFLPPPLPSDASAVTDSILAAVLTGGPRAPSLLLRTHLGLDFSRNWAVAFLSKALLPALLGTGLLCWGLTGVKLIDLGQRGVYERFGAPVAVLGPGLHLVMPWPFGRLLPVEYGAIHSVWIGVDQAEADQTVTVDAEAAPPLVLNRLWETSHPGQAYYLVPSTGTGPQGFQSVATEISVLYRVGLTDSAALQSVYTVADPEALVREDAGRLVLRFFNSRTLEEVIGARRENVADTLRDQLATDVASQNAGIDIVSVLIEEIHPPGGAASAYHAVQAAEINSTASIFEEQAKAELTAGNAQQQANQLTTAADAKADEIKHTADAAAYRFDADRRAFGAGGRAFLLERFYGNLDTALSKTPVTILDHRLNAADGPILDLRPPTPGGTPEPATAPLVPTVIPGVGSGH